MNTLLNRLLLWQKFSFLALLSAILVSVPLILYINESDKTIEAAELEVRGIVPVQALLKVVQLTQQHRGLSAMVLGGNEEAKNQRASKQQEVDQAVIAMDGLARQVADAAIAEKWQQARGEWMALAGKVSQQSISGKDVQAQIP